MQDPRSANQQVIELGGELDINNTDVETYIAASEALRDIKLKSIRQAIVKGFGFSHDDTQVEVSDEPPLEFQHLMKFKESYDKDSRPFILMFKAFGVTFPDDNPSFETFHDALENIIGTLHGYVTDGSDLWNGGFDANGGYIYK